MAFLEQSDVHTAYTETKDHMRQYFQSFDEFERLARNRPSPKIEKNLPKTTDGTLAAIVQEQPKRVVQQTPTGKVYCPDYPEYAEVAGYVLENRLLPMGNTQGSDLQKSWTMINKALTYGMQPSYTFFTNTGDTMHTDYSIPYIKDILVEKGKVFGPDSNIEFMRNWYTDSDIKGIIAREKKFKEQDKNYKSDWDLKLLADLLVLGETKEKEENTPAETEKGVVNGGYEIIHAFQKGVKSKFYSFATAIPDKIIRTKTNPDPRGETPIDYLYCNIDLSNPYGRGAVEMSGGIQNLIDHQMVMFQFMSTMMMGPPLQLWGNVNKASIKYRPNALWDMGSNPNNLVKPFEVNNQAIANFPSNYGLLKSQILNLNSSLDTSVSAESGNPGFSKTPAGVKSNEARLSISDNYMRKQFEKWKQDQNETALNIYFSEMEGTDTVDLPNESVSDMTEETLSKYYDEKDGKLKVPYGKIKEAVFKFKVDPSSSEVKSKAENAEKLTELLRISQNILPDDQKYKLVKLIAEEIGAEGVEKIFPDPESVAGEEEAAKQEEMKAQMQGQQAALAGQQVANSPQAQPVDAQMAQGGVMPPPMPAQPMMQPQPMPVAPPQPQGDPAFAQALLSKGFTPEDVQQAEVMMQQGYPADQILQVLVAAKQGGQ